MDTNNIYREMLENMYEGVYFVDVNRKITFWNKGAERISGFTSKEILGKYCYDNILNHVNDEGTPLCKQGCPLHKSIVDGLTRESGIYLHHKDGHRVAVSVRTIPIIEDGKIVGAVEVFVDDSNKADLVKRMNELKVLAMYDQLTELPNRRYIDTFLDNRMREFNELNIPFTVILMDIDLFKNFNDSYGHDIGDVVLKMVANTLKSSFRKSDLIGRWGGEEFMAILPNVTQDEVKMVMEKARMLVEKSIYRNHNPALSVTISLGASMVMKNDTPEVTVKRADSALYESKEKGRNRFTLF